LFSIRSMRYGTKKGRVLPSTPLRPGPPAFAADLCQHEKQRGWPVFGLRTWRDAFVAPAIRASSQRVVAGGARQHGEIAVDRAVFGGALKNRPLHIAAGLNCAALRCQQNDGKGASTG